MRETGIDMEWKTFAGSFHNELCALIIFRARKDGIDTNNKDALADYFRAHLERGISHLQQASCLMDLASAEPSASDRQI